MRKLIYALLLTLTVFSLVALSVFLIITQPEASVNSKPGMHFSDLKRVQALANQFQPSKLVSGHRYIVTLSQRELNLLATTLLTQSEFAQFSNIELNAEEDEIRFNLSVPVLFAIKQRWLNIALNFTIQPGQLPSQSLLSIGGWQMPEVVNRYVASLWEERVPNNWVYLWEAAMVKVGVVDQGIHFGFSWIPETADLMPDFYPGNQQAVARKTLAALESVAAQNHKRLDLSEFFELLFQHWEPDVTEVPVIMVVLSQYISGNSIGELYALPEVNSVRIRLYLSGRRDLARHFLISAMLAAQVGESVASQLGYLKELSDAENKSSGFSVSDLLANKAGILFYSKLMSSVNNSSFPEFVQDLKLGLLPSRSVLDDLDVQLTGWDETALAVQLNQLPFYSTKSASGRHKRN